jgi:hypothetical protein
MKKFIILLFTGALISCANAQTSKEVIKKEISLVSAAKEVTLEVYNLRGSVKVEGYSGDKIIVEIDKTVTGKSQSDINLALNEFELGIDQNTNNVVIYTKAPYDTRPNQKNNSSTQRDYGIKLDFSIKVPHDINLKLSTINDGNLISSKVYGELHLNNINGAISVQNAKSLVNLQTINGGIDVVYDSAPLDGSSYHTINGTINATYPSTVSADLKLKSMNGSFYTDFPEAEVVPKTIIKKSDNSYKLNKDTHLKIGNGESKLSFETLNGDIYIKKK